MNEICYVENAPSLRDVPPGFRVRELTATEKPPAWGRWLGASVSAKRIVYREHCRLSWEDLELVSLVPQGSSRGMFCWCELAIQVRDPAQLLGELGESSDGQWSVTREALEAWFRPQLVAAFESTGSQGDLRSEAFWPSVSGEVRERLICPRGVILDHGGEQDPRQLPAVLLRKVLSYEQFLEVLTRKEEFRARLELVQRDGTLLRYATGGRLEQLLQEIGEQRVADLLTPAERASSADQRVSTYIEILGAPSGAELRTGVVIGNFQLQSELGRGGMGEVWKAWDTKAARPVVIKLVPPELQHADEEMARVKAAFQRTHALNHQHICPVYLLDHDRRFGWYVVMKYIDGQTLSAYRATSVAQHGCFPLEQVVRLLRPIAEALDYAHGQKAIHRDIKPENILVLGQGEDMQLIDFGLAAEIRSSVTRVSQVRMEISGARPYMAPEQWRGDYQDQRTDQYALAVVAYELLAGRLPFDSTDFDILRACVLNDPPPPIQDQPDAVNRALMLGLAKRREERFPTCLEFIQAIAAGAQSVLMASSNEPVVATQTPADKPSKKLAIILLTSFVGAVLLAALALHLSDLADGVSWSSVTQEKRFAEIERVSGRVSLDGQPVAEAVVMFLPRAGGDPSFGRTNSAGIYDLQDTGTAPEPVDSLITTTEMYEFPYPRPAQGASIAEHVVLIAVPGVGVACATANVTKEMTQDFRLDSNQDFPIRFADLEPR
jgi:serine/threonine protein kinase